MAIGVGIVNSQDIDTIGIAPATRRAMRDAVSQMPLWPQYLLVDALNLPEISLPQKAIIHGDALCLSIAAASIIAKVTRDRFMVLQDDVYPGYDFKSHKGYGTSVHMESLRRLGPCVIHRRSFAPIRDLVEKCNA